MSEKICPNCYFKNDGDSEFCQECDSALDLKEYIESKKFDTTDFNKLKAIVYGEEKTNEINHEIEEFIILSQNFHDYEIDLINLKSGKFNKSEFKNKYKIISKLDDFRYLVEINNDKDLNKKLLFMKSVKSFLTNFDEEIKKLETLLKDINLKLNGIESFNFDLNKLLTSEVILDVSNKNDLIQSHKFTYDFFDRDKIKELNIDSKDKINDFLNKYENLNQLFNKHNEEVKIKKHDDLVSTNSNKACEFIDKIENLNETEEFIPTTRVDELKTEFKESYEFLKGEDISNFDDSIKSNVSKFLRDYVNIEDIIEKINNDLSIKILQNKVNSKTEELNQFNNDLNNLLESNFFITFKQKDALIGKYKDLCDLISEANEKIDLSKDFKEFLKIYPKIESTINIRNKDYVQKELEEHKEFFDNIDGKSLDYNQRLAVVKNELN